MPEQASALQISHGLVQGFFDEGGQRYNEVLSRVQRAGAYNVNDPRNLMALPNDLRLANALSAAGTPITRHASNHPNLYAAQKEALDAFLGSTVPGSTLTYTQAINSIQFDPNTGAPTNLTTTQERVTHTFAVEGACMSPPR